MRAYERLINYVKIKSPSCEEAKETPTSKGQIELGELLVKELKSMGVLDAKQDDKGYVYAKIPASLGFESKPMIGLISHLDTFDAFIDADINPRIHENYQGQVIKLNDRIALDPANFPDLADEAHKGKTLITSDGNTLLGADGKAGIAEIMSAIEELLSNDFKHPGICIAFIPDENLLTDGSFNILEFSADYAYTFDGGDIGDLEYDNFNAAKAEIEIRGVSVHTGDAKNVMKNAAKIAAELAGMLPRLSSPEHTEGYEGFFHLSKIYADQVSGHMTVLIRDHDMQLFEDKKAYLGRLCRYINDKHGAGTAVMTIEEQYRNMLTVMKDKMFLIKDARAACEKAGVVTTDRPVRGGTVGSKLSFMGIPCPNIGSGGACLHGPYEYIFAEDMDKMVSVIINLITK